MSFGPIERKGRVRGMRTTREASLPPGLKLAERLIGSLDRQGVAPDRLLKRLDMRWREEDL